MHLAVLYLLATAVETMMIKYLLATITNDVLVPSRDQNPITYFSSNFLGPEPTI